MSVDAEPTPAESGLAARSNTLFTLYIATSVNAILEAHRANVGFYGGGRSLLWFVVACAAAGLWSMAAAHQAWGGNLDTDGVLHLRGAGGRDHLGPGPFVVRPWDQAPKTPVFVADSSGRTALVKRSLADRLPVRAATAIDDQAIDRAAARTGRVVAALSLSMMTLVGACRIAGL